MQAPARMENPTGIPLTPTPIGSWPYTFWSKLVSKDVLDRFYFMKLTKACVGQNMRMEKKLAPEMNVMTKVRARMRGSCCRRFGNIGFFAP